MSELSSHSLFHYTSSLEILEDILETGFRFSIIGERIPGNKLAYFIPSISFCSIPLSKMSDHADWYGHYAIGVKPIWVKQHGGTPVVYCHSTSPFISHSNSGRYHKDFLSNRITPYLKQTLGNATNEKMRKRKDFMDEKEWRIVDKDYSLVIDQFENQMDFQQKVKDKKEKYSPKYLKITPSYIDYIMLEKKSDLPKFIEWLKAKNVDENIYTTLIPRILIYYNLRKDI